MRYLVPVLVTLDTYISHSFLRPAGGLHVLALPGGAHFFRGYLMENGIKVFERQEFGQVRVVDVNGEPWFVAKDVAQALGFASNI